MLIIFLPVRSATGELCSMEIPLEEKFAEIAVCQVKGYEKISLSNPILLLCILSSLWIFPVFLRRRFYCHELFGVFSE